LAVIVYDAKSEFAAGFPTNMVVVVNEETAGATNLMISSTRHLVCVCLLGPRSRDVFTATLAWLGLSTPSTIVAVP
jgi:uncharacterized protein (UPF0371 family)